MDKIKFKGMHPESGFLISSSNLAPNLYYPEKPRKFQNIDFKRKEEVEDFSRNLGFKVPEILREKIAAIKKLGPAWHDPYNLEYLPLISANACLKSKSHGFSLAIRFCDEKSRTPGPGTYIRKHKDLIRHQWSPVNSFDWSKPRGSQRDSPSWSLAPNRYMYERDYNSIFDNLKRRKVSKRGPYDLFTGPRDETTIKGYFGPPLPREAKTWPYELLSSIDALLQDKYKGCWSDCPRKILMATRDVHTVSPCHYDPILTSSYKPQRISECGFNSCKDPARPEVQYKVHPGPGRYTIKKRKCGKGCCSSPFQSKVDRFHYVVKKRDHLC